MSSIATPGVSPESNLRKARARLNATDLRANRAIKWLALSGGILVFVVLMAIVYQVLSGASSSFDRYGIAFIGHKSWVPVSNEFGAWTYIYGTLITSVVSLVLATILGVSIGLFLALIAPRRVAMIVGPLVEMLASIPSVVLGLIGIALLAPFIRSHIEPWWHTLFGWTQLFGRAEPVGNSLFAASLVLTIMVVPIIAALTRDLFLTVPRELLDGAEALGATRFEMIRGVVLPTTQSGIVAACVLGFGRAIGEAIAVGQIVGGIPADPLDLFKGGDTMAALIANQALSPVNALETSSLFYLAAILLFISVVTNFTAQWISSSFGRKIG
jgi:phosphate transport system permease protein